MDELLRGCIHSKEFRCTNDIAKKMLERKNSPLSIPLKSITRSFIASYLNVKWAFNYALVLFHQDPNLDINYVCITNYNNSLIDKKSDNVSTIT